MYDIDTPYLVIGLLLLMLIGMTVGYSIGTHRHNTIDEAFHSQTTAVQGSLLGLLALLLGFTFVLSGAMMGYSSEVAGRQPDTPVYLMLILIVCLVFMIIDLDRPRRGLIEVNQDPMRALVETVKEASTQ